MNPMTASLTAIADAKKQEFERYPASTDQTTGTIACSAAVRLAELGTEYDATHVNAIHRCADRLMELHEEHKRDTACWEGHSDALTSENARLLQAIAAIVKWSDDSAAMLRQGYGPVPPVEVVGALQLLTTVKEHFKDVTQDTQEVTERNVTASIPGGLAAYREQVLGEALAAINRLMAPLPVLTPAVAANPATDDERPSRKWLTTLVATLQKRGEESSEFSVAEVASLLAECTALRATLEEEKARLDWYEANPTLVSHAIGYGLARSQWTFHRGDHNVQLADSLREAIDSARSSREIQEKKEP